jgi:sec-independent protein translocase protein TatA
MGGIGQQELILLMAFALIFFGAKKLPEIARGIGKGMSEFRKAARDIQMEINREVDQVKKLDPRRDSPPPVPPPPPSQELTDPVEEEHHPPDPAQEGEQDQDRNADTE